MNRVLITGAGSYIGTHIAAHLSQYPDRFEVCELDVQKGLPKQAFSGFDTVIHVAGIAHRKETPGSEALYQAVNATLAADAAKQAKLEGVKQFIFFSSMSVYGMTVGRITADTQPAPSTYYGQSKLAAEKSMVSLADECFHIATLRPPMIYGKGCRGNYPRLASFARKLPVFPKTRNERSMLYIGTLCTFVEKLIESGEGGLYFPQNAAYVNTSDMVRRIAACHGKTLLCIPGFGWLLRLLESHVGVVGKVFGTLTYDLSMSTAFRDENELPFAKTIEQTEVGE